LLPREAIRKISMCVPRQPASVGFVAQPINQSLLGFETQTKKHCGDFEAQTRKPSTTLVLRLNQEIVR
jgi:hypothetical protein